ncbi:hypothetical protein JKP88DRAFT_288420 [Tribonema minus]|uniref:Uncharacterized protein n=1 Tax=Tribonema minus TaxID=303371 RepID=A0A835Z3P6_9STRA|nr:hypothetical protein JKP88DRAFT_288420 [Tribonema minus]
MEQDTPRGPLFRQIGGTRKRANAIFAATIGRAKKCRRRMPAQWTSARRCSRTSTAEDPITPPLLRSLVLKAISSYKQHAHFGGGGTTMSHAHPLLALLLQACSPVAAMDDGPGLDNSYMAPLVSAAAGAAAAVIAAATDSSGSDDEDATATALRTEQLNAEQRRQQHPLPVTAADYHHMEAQIQQALAEDLQLQQTPTLMMDDEDSDMDASDADASDAEDSDVEDSNSHAIPTSTTAAGGAPAIAARAASAARNAFARIKAFCISGCNDYRAAHKLIGGAVLALQTSLVNGDPAVLIQKSNKHKVEVQERRN